MTTFPRLTWPPTWRNWWTPGSFAVTRPGAGNWSTSRGGGKCGARNPRKPWNPSSRAVPGTTIWKPPAPCSIPVALPEDYTTGTVVLRDSYATPTVTVRYGG